MLIGKPGKQSTAHQHILNEAGFLKFESRPRKVFFKKIAVTSGSDWKTLGYSKMPIHFPHINTSFHTGK